MQKPEADGEPWTFPSFDYSALDQEENNEQNFQCEFFTKLLETLNISLCGKEMVGGDEPKEGEEEDDDDEEDGDDEEEEDGDDEDGDDEEGDDVENNEMASGVNDGPFTDENVEDTQDVSTEDASSTPEQTSTQEDVSSTPEQTLTQDASTQDPSTTEDASSTPEQTLNQEASTEEIQTQEEDPSTQDVSTPEESLTQEEIPEEAAALAAAAAISSTGNCESMGAALETIFQGLILETSDDGQSHLFAFFDYDAILKLIKNPEDPAASPDAIFCSTNKPINDENDESPFRWGTIDELLFEKRMFEKEVDPVISTMFKNNDVAWNITDANNELVDFPFVVFALKETDSGVFETVTSDQAKKYADSHGESVLSATQTDHYGNEELVNEYGSRFCFTPKPIGIQQDNIPKRFVLFAVNPEYKVDENAVESLASNSQYGGDPNAPPAEDPNAPIEENSNPVEDPNAPPEEDPNPVEDPNVPMDDPNVPMDDPNAPMDDPNAPMDDPNAPPVEDPNAPAEDPNTPPMEEISNAPEEDLQQMDSEQTDSTQADNLQIPVIYTITNNAFTNNIPIVTWATKSKLFCGL
jgi:hypothetical protein